MNTHRSIYTSVWLWRFLLGTTCSQTPLLIGEKIRLKFSELMAPKIVSPFIVCNASLDSVFFLKSFTCNLILPYVYCLLSMEPFFALFKNPITIIGHWEKDARTCGLSNLGWECFPDIIIMVVWVPGSCDLWGYWIIFKSIWLLFVSV